MDPLVALGIFNGLSVASILLLVALGLAITFGLMNVINMAHGQFIMVGAYVAYVCRPSDGGSCSAQPHAGNGFSSPYPRRSSSPRFWAGCWSAG